jgi:hypothetical protein
LRPPALVLRTRSTFGLSLGLSFFTKASALLLRVAKSARSL